jgi:cold shock CspA family protein
MQTKQPTGAIHHGYVQRLNTERGFGFVSVPGEPDAFFRVNDLADRSLFSEQLVERRVRFCVFLTEKGLRATAIELAED